MILVIREDRGTTPVGLVYGRHCAVSAPGLDRNVVYEDARSYFGRPATNSEAALDMWSFQSSRGTRQFLRLEGDAYYEAVASKMLSQMTIDGDGSVSRVTYSESLVIRSVPVPVCKTC